MTIDFTLRVDDELAEGARTIAARRGMSVDELMGDLLETLVHRDRSYEVAKERALAQLEQGYDLGWSPPASRHESHER